MTIAFFRIPLSVKPQDWGQAELVLPDVLQGLNYHFVVVKEGGEEGIVRVEAPTEALTKIEKKQGFERLNKKQMQDLQKSYLPLKLKQKYRVRAQTQEEGREMIGEQFEVDKQGNRVVDTIQTIRSGFHLIDVPILTQA